MRIFARTMATLSELNRDFEIEINSKEEQYPISLINGTGRTVGNFETTDELAMFVDGMLEMMEIQQNKKLKD